MSLQAGGFLRPSQVKVKFKVTIKVFVSLTAAKFKPLIFSTSGFTFSYAVNMFILMILYDLCLLPAQFCYIILYIRKVEKSCFCFFVVFFVVFVVVVVSSLYLLSYLLCIHCCRVSFIVVFCVLCLIE
jgi:hypothetical protein